MGSERTDVEFTSDGVVIRAWLYRPNVPNPPIIVMAHGLGGVKTMRLDAFAERFVEAGYACLVFDYRHFGDSDGEPRQLLSVRRQLADYDAAIEYAKSLDDVDAARIVVWGSSFSGGHALTLAARQPGLAAAVSQCPFTSGPASLLALDLISSVKVTGRAVADIASSALHRDPVLVGLAGHGHDAALMTAPDAEPGYLSLVPDGASFTNSVTARAGLAIPFYSPARHMRRIGVPTFVAICETDSVAPPGPTIRAAQGNPHITAKVYPYGHFDIYVGDAFDDVVADEIEFLRDVVPVSH
ncbi:MULTISPECIES: alpha/beta hydrolase [Gordonia]|uniref:alpha/beta hydrolase n=1 Tax=Gordonia TaxID=2053 RepID=UPI00257C1F85|nr:MULTISPECIES: alpha/beta fold hydrolase [Gordonia]